MIFQLVCLVALGTGGKDLVSTDEVDTIELNSYHDCKGKLVFRQLIFWNLRYVRRQPDCWRGPWQPWNSVCEGWRICKRFPLVEKRGNRFVIHFFDKRNGDGFLRKIVAKSVVRTWTQHDPEVVNRRLWPVGKRVFGR